MSTSTGTANDLTGPEDVFDPAAALGPVASELSNVNVSRTDRGAETVFDPSAAQGPSDGTEQNVGVSRTETGAVEVTGAELAPLGPDDGDFDFADGETAGQGTTPDAASKGTTYPILGR